MDFFKSVFSDEPEAASDVNSQTQTAQDRVGEESLSSAGGWSFGGLLKSIASKSESVIESYKKDLEELSSELKKETQVIRQVASKAVKDLPGSLEVGASVAQESLESVGQAIDDLGNTVWRGTAGMISHGKDVLVNVEFLESQTGYSRFHSQIVAIQTDLNTYLEEPEDMEEFDKWKSGFVLGEKDEEIDCLLTHNGVMESLYNKVTPATVDDGTFWTRYFYKVYKLKQAEEARANLVKRAIAGGEDEEDLSWDIDDDYDHQGPLLLLEGNSTNTDQLDSCKYSDVSLVSTQPSQDLSWDEIEHLSGTDDKITSLSSNIPATTDLRNRLSLPDEDQHLTWDIEDDD